MRADTKRSATVRMILQVILLTIAFAILLAEWTLAVLTVFWTCFGASSFIGPKWKARPLHNPFDPKSQEGLISIVQFMAAFVVIRAASRTLPDGWFSSVIRNPSSLFACWVLTVLQAIRWYLRAIKEEERLPTAEATVSSHSAPNGDS